MAEVTSVHAILRDMVRMVEEGSATPDDARRILDALERNQARAAAVLAAREIPEGAEAFVERANQAMQRFAESLATMRAWLARRDRPTATKALEAMDEAERTFHDLYREASSAVEE